MAWAVDYDAEIIRRIERVQQIRSNPHYWPVLQEHYAKLEPQSCIDFINHWCVTYDPRAVAPMPKIMPFRLFPRQEDYVHFLIGCLKDKECGLTEKSRDMGITWLCCAISTWLWRFFDGMAIGWGSRKEEYVDHKGDPKAIFPKMRQIIENWPDFVRPAGYDAHKHATYMRLINPSNGSVIVGEAGDGMGRGGRTTLYIKDESSHYERPELIEAALGDNTDVQIDVSSVNGTNNVFYKKRMAGEVWYKDAPVKKGYTRIFIFDWRDNPMKSQEWYNTRRDAAERNGLLHLFAQEVERNYNSSIERIIIPPEWVDAAIDAHKKLNITPAGEKVAGQDIADGGKDKNALVIRHGIITRYADHWGGDAGAAAQVAIPICAEYGVRKLAYDSIGVGAGFKNEINNMRMRGGLPRYLLVTPWNAGAGPVDPDENIIPGDMQSPTNDDQYANLKAQAWFRLRTRFYKTYQAVRNGQSFNADELISLDSTLPRLHEIKNELSQAQYKSSLANGKTIVDKKPDGAFSPNLADALVMAYNPAGEVSIFDVL
jgi:phage terminase large subunit